ncbi:MAG: CHAP domain-containing protein [Intrasporangium sp.]|uniref:CHAP domain-containing protein n=1 Tax=Intrasporangium sp. TaxID=1925024 RepID=UPI0026496193|nr:CHAP domain-containing protein [Intrasporangium sp.]MDN5797653.1 CHAP domain-containing protein [Intrasporangium sp.]
MTIFALVTVALSGIPTANAATRYGTVKVTTQRMTGPHLANFRQQGTYPAGKKLVLKCYLWGQMVSGWGGTSNLWYQTSDGYYAADVDLYTGTNNPITGLCPTISINSFVSQTKGKVWANALGTYPGQCVSLVSQYLLRVRGISTRAWRGNAVDYRSGGIAGKRLKALGYTWHTNKSFKTGDILVWGPSTSSVIDGNGHIAIWHAAKLYDQNNRRHNPIASANYSPFMSGGYLGYWRK